MGAGERWTWTQHCDESTTRTTWRGGGRGSHGKNARSKPLFPNITHIERSSRLLYFAGLLRDFDHVCFFTRFKHAGKKTRSKTSLYNTKPDGWNHLN